jgi:hypothetical protein
MNLSSVVFRDLNEVGLHFLMFMQDHYKVLKGALVNAASKLVKVY